MPECLRRFLITYCIKRIYFGWILIRKECAIQSYIFQCISFMFSEHYGSVKQIIFQKCERTILSLCSYTTRSSRVLTDGVPLKSVHFPANWCLSHNFKTNRFRENALMLKNARKRQIRHVGGARIARGARFITNGTQYARPVSPLSTSVGRMSLRPSVAELLARERSRVGRNFRHFAFSRFPC